MLGKSLSELFCTIILFAVFSVLIQCEYNMAAHCPNVKTSLRSIRKRRHLIFPEGSSVVLTTSTVKTFMTHVPSGWYFVMELDLVFPLPNHDFIASHLRKKWHHRQKRELWDKLRDGLEYHNLKGSACILRSVCEAQQYLAPPGRSLVHDLLRAVFTAPLDDEEFVNEVRSSYSELMEPAYCDQQIDCPFSPVLFILSLNEQKYLWREN